MFSWFWNEWPLTDHKTWLMHTNANRKFNTFGFKSESVIFWKTENGFSNINTYNEVPLESRFQGWVCGGLRLVTCKRPSLLLVIIMALLCWLKEGWTITTWESYALGYCSMCDVFKTKKLRLCAVHVCFGGVLLDFDQKFKKSWWPFVAKRGVFVVAGGVLVVRLCGSPLWSAKK